MAETLASVLEKKSAATQVNSWRRFFVLLEVVTVSLLSFAVLAGVQYLIPVFVSPGDLRWTLLHLGPRMAIFIPICLVLFLTRKASKSYGVSVSDWSDGLKIGALLCALGAMEITLTLVLFRNVNFSGWDARGNLIGVCIVLPNLVLFGWILNFFQSVAKRLPTFVALLALIGVWANQASPEACDQYQTPPSNPPPRELVCVVYCHCYHLCRRTCLPFAPHADNTIQGKARAFGL